MINDINPKLTACYQVVRDEPQQLIASLTEIQQAYYCLPSEEAKREFFLDKRKAFNGKLDTLELVTLFIFLNRTCFNGLYRENKKGDFNVPFGKYAAPTICDANTIMADSKLLQKVEILTGDYHQTMEFAGDKTLFYFDPPYRPLSNTSSFNDYTQQPFNDDAQRHLKDFCDQVNEEGYQFMLSNSDCFAKGNDPFFEELYEHYEIDRVWAKRNINANACKRGKLTEILVHNYRNTKQQKAFENIAFVAEEIHH